MIKRRRKKNDATQKLANDPPDFFNFSIFPRFRMGSHRSQSAICCWTTLGGREKPASTQVPADKSALDLNNLCTGNLLLPPLFSFSAEPLTTAVLGREEKLMEIVRLPAVRIGVTSSFTFSLLFFYRQHFVSLLCKDPCGPI